MQSFFTVYLLASLASLVIQDGRRGASTTYLRRRSPRTFFSLFHFLFSLHAFIIDNICIGRVAHAVSIYLSYGTLLERAQDDGALRTGTASARNVRNAGRRGFAPLQIGIHFGGRRGEASRKSEKERAAAAINIFRNVARAKPRCFTAINGTSTEPSRVYDALNCERISDRSRA